MKHILLVVLAPLLVFVLIAAKPEKKYYDEVLRPQFHFSPPENWHNDPNGLIFFEGEYNMFYQYNPNGKEWGYMHWGHTVSKDLVHWEHMPIALFPDNDSKDIKDFTAFSGTAIVDETNLLNFQKGDIKTLIAFYTCYKGGQRIAYSTDKGRNWEKFEGNPVIPFDETDDARDPKVFWHNPSQKFVMVLYREPDKDESKRGFSFYTSTNLIDWDFKNHMVGFYECPDLVELSVDNRPEDKRWVLIDGDGSYIIGSFDGETFKSESEKLPGDFGANFYATQTWSNIPKEDGRTIQIAWMRDGKFPGMPFNGQMSFPCELSLKKVNDKIRLIRKPVKEIELLHGKNYNWENKNIIPGLDENLIKKVKGDCFHITATLDIKTSDMFGFMIRTGRKSAGAELLYNVKKGTLSCLGKTVSLNPIDGKIYLEVLVDRSSIEVFCNKGIAVLSGCFVPDAKSEGMLLFTQGGELMVDQLDINEINSVWRKE